MTSTSTRKPGAMFFWIGLSLVTVWAMLYLSFAAYPAGFGAAIARTLMWCLALVIVFTCAGVAAVQRRRSPVILVCAAAGIGVLSWFFGMPIALQARYMFLRDTLTSERERLASGHRGTYWSERAIDVDGNKAQIPSELPVAFVDGGLLDNWSGFVFDPTGQLAAAPRQYPKMPLPMRTWFGGDMTYALPLGNGWFYCWFT